MNPIGIIGLGYVGLPLLLTFHEAGINVIGFDIDPSKPEHINAGETYLRTVTSERIKRALVSSRATVEATTDMSRLRECSAILMCVPTPLDAHGQPDMQYVDATTKTVAKFLVGGQLVVLESSTYPGTTTERIKPVLETSGLVAGVDFHLAFSPEREDPGNPTYRTENTPKVVGGLTPACTARAAELYQLAIQTVCPVSSPAVAEMTKLLENIFRGVNIALVNELKTACTAMGIDIWEVIQAASTKPFGFMPFYPGPGLGGHCIPIDPFYFTWKAKEYGITSRFIELAGEINTQMPRYVVTRIAEALNKHEKSLRLSNILILGVAYKPDIDDLRESPALEIISLLEDAGAVVCYHDPYIPVIGKSRKSDIIRHAVSLDNLGQYDAVVVVTNHSCYDWVQIESESRLIIDTRNVVKAGPRVIRA